MNKITITEPFQHHVLPDTHGPLTVDVESLSQISDGYHTIGELYEHRIVLFIALCRQIASEDFVDNQNRMKDVNRVWRSKVHSDHLSFEGLFILGIGKDPGKQITYYLPNSQWEATDFAETLDCAFAWGWAYGSEKVLKRLKEL